MLVRSLHKHRLHVKLPDIIHSVTLQWTSLNAVNLTTLGSRCAGDEAETKRTLIRASPEFHLLACLFVMVKLTSLRSCLFTSIRLQQFGTLLKLLSASGT